MGSNESGILLAASVPGLLRMREEDSSFSFVLLLLLYSGTAPRDLWAVV